MTDQPTSETPETDAPSPGVHWNRVLRREFAQESDRATVIVAVVLLDSALETLLRSRLAPAPSSQDTLLEGAYAPLSTFSSRIDAAYRLGLISAAFARDLHVVRRIRNEFAHNISGCSFQDSGVRHRVAEIYQSAGLGKRAPQSRSKFPEGAKGDFEMTISWMQWCLRELAAEIQPIEPAGREWPYIVGETR